MSVWNIAKQCIYLEINTLTIAGHKVENIMYSTFFDTNVKDMFDDHHV